LKLLLLGGTKFLGRAISETALALGHELSLFTRGETNPELFPEAEHLTGDRERDLSALEGRRWDTVIDTSGYVPHIVRASAELLSPAAEHYSFVSSISVYPDYSQPVHEESPLAELGDMPADVLADDYSNYGALKTLCEREVVEAFPGRSLAVRAGLIVGPHDPTGRFTYWPHRVARGGEVLAPGPPDRPVQFVDVRDLAEWIVRASEERLSGAFNATSEPYRLGELLDACVRVTGSDATVTWVDEGFLLEREVGQWMELPLWVAAEPGGERFHEADTTKAHTNGLRERPLDEIVRATLDDAETVDGVGLASDREAGLLRAWHERGA
jgi:nucleoside-diphosphate-sugar epimerase